MSAILIKQPPPDKVKKQIDLNFMYYVIWRQWESHYNQSNWQGLLPLIAFKVVERLYCNLQDTMKAYNIVY